MSLKKKFNNLLTIIIPRHVGRINEIDDEIKSIGLKTTIRTSQKRIDNKTDIYLVDTYGETAKFFKISKIAFIGGSLANHGGQNPIEPARFNINILHGPNIHNFKDIYSFFNKKNIAHKINNSDQLKHTTLKLLNTKRNKKINLDKIGNMILKKSIMEIVRVLNDEIKKT